MTTADSRPCFHLMPLLGLAVLVAAMLISVPAFAQDDQPPGELPQSNEAYCLGCHADPDLSITLPSGEELSLTISVEDLEHSIHQNVGIECRSCHVEITTYPHPEITYQNHRELSLNFYQSCERCHSDNYDQTLDSMHAQVAEAGNLDSPICTDCHGAHDILDPDQPRTRVSNTCGQCHTSIFDDYQNSVHGIQLEENNPDVPVCTDCHGVHNISDARTALFRIESPELCAGCHADAELMDKYGLTTNVYDLYQTSWHGVDVAVYKAQWPSIWHESAVCTDCHGVHNILATHNPDSMVNPANLLTTCQACHPDAGENWTGAWTGHHEVSKERTPFVFYTEVFYSSFGPFVLITSAVYVGLQILRALIARVRRSMS
jgi:predicted CXXCH cytochrome family protein